MRTVNVWRLMLLIAAVVAGATAWPRAQAPQKITVNYPTRSGASWHLTPKEGGYYKKYGLDVDRSWRAPHRHRHADERPSRDGQPLARARNGGEHARRVVRLLGSSSNKGPSC
jgi:hypothetical protein